MFIGSALQHDKPPCNGRNKVISTIHVNAYKEKFGACIVSCKLADFNRVAKVWAELGNIDKPSDDFINLRWRLDARYYRRVYFDMFELAPHYCGTIFNGAEHKELLFRTKSELQSFFDHVEVLDSNDEPTRGHRYVRKYQKFGFIINDVQGLVSTISILTSIV
jgi:hypothetical protein